MVLGKRVVGLSVLLGMVTLQGCNSQGFTGGGATVQPVKQTEKPENTPQNSFPDPVPEAGCTEAKLISLRSLTTTIDQKSPTRSVDVQLTFEPCPNQLNEMSYPLWFDVDGSLDFGGSTAMNLNYELSGSSVQASTGAVSFIIGTDLFGKSGSEYGHFESSSPLRASPALTTAVLKIKLNTVKILGPAIGPAPSFGNFQIPLHVKVGSAAPVTGTLTFSQP